MPVIRNKNEKPSDGKLRAEVQLKNNSFWLSYLAAQYEKQGDVNEVMHYQNKFDRVTKVSLKNFANTYLSGSNSARIVMLPEAFKPP